VEIWLKILLVFNCMAACSALAADVERKTGLAIAPGVELVSTVCTVCHSSKIIIQNRADRDGWRDMIRWMQEKQGLWPLGEQEAAILDYLSSQYGPQSSARRRPLAAELLPPQ